MSHGNALTTRSLGEILICVGNALQAHFRVGTRGVTAKTHLAIYGNIQMVRVFCDDCELHALVVGGRKQCCDELAQELPSRIKRMSQPDFERRLPPMAERTRILEVQHYRCLYCDVAFDGYAWCRGRFQKVQLQWDHMTPYAYSMNNRHQNYAAACQFCNKWKTDLIFETVDEVRVYVAAKWEKERNRFQDLRERGVFNPLPGEAPLAKVLQSAVPVPRLGSTESAHLKSKTMRCRVCKNRVTGRRKAYCSERCRIRFKSLH